MRKQKKASVRTIKQLQAGQEKAFDKIYEAYVDKFYFMAYNFFKNQSDAEDMVQEIFIKILQNIKTLKNPDVFHVWVHRLAYNTCLNAIKKKSFEIKGIYEDGEIENYEDIHITPITNQVAHKEINEMILDIIQTMPVSLRYVTLFRFYEQLSIAEIADILEISENAVKLRISRARLYIKESLEAQGVAPEVINSSLDTKALFLMFVSMEAVHKFTLTGESLAVHATTQTATLSTTSLTVLGSITAVIIAGGALVYTNSQNEEKPAESQTVVIENSQITNIDYPHEYTNQEIEISVETTNTNYDYIAINDKKTTIIGNNGTYTVSLMKDNKPIDSKEIIVDNIDVDSPVRKSIQREGNTYTITFQDDLSMIDENKIEVYQEKTKINAYYFDAKTQSIKLTIDSQYTYHIIVCDKAGNYTYVTTNTN